MVKPEKIKIIRDEWGIPHIFSETNEDAAYGLGFATCEDGFNTIQQTLAIGNGCYGDIIGLKGLEYDYIVQLLELKERCFKHYETEISEEYKKFLEAYASGINKYAEKYPKQILSKRLFPLTPQKILIASHVASLGFARIGDALNRMAKGKQKSYKRNLGGSNAFAYSKKITESNETVLVTNPHQPIKGFLRYYEYHLKTDEGLNIMCQSIMGLPFPLVGANEHIAWALTRNYMDLYDTYALNTHSSKKNMYELDGKWYPLEKKYATLKINPIKGISFSVKKAVYKSIHGPVLKGKEGYFALRMPALNIISAPQQWFEMAKANNIDEFKNALSKQRFANGNVIYADKEDNIFYLYNGLFIQKNKKYTWNEDIPGNFSDAIWEEKYIPVKDLPQIHNPTCGYVFNCNHTPYQSSSENDSVKPNELFKTICVQTTKNSRSIRAQYLIENILREKGKLSLNDIKNIKYDITPPKDFYYEYLNVHGFYTLNSKDYPDLSKEIKQITQHTLTANINDSNIALLILAAEFIRPNLAIVENIDFKLNISSHVYANALRKAKKYLIKHYGTTKVELGKIQYIQRGNKKLPAPGMRGTLHYTISKIKKNGTMEVIDGEALLSVVRFKNNEVYIESILPYGNSDNPKSPHFNDQMELFVNRKTKKILFYESEILQNATKIYHPL